MGSEQLAETEKQNVVPKVENYLNYREYLRDFYHYKKTVNSSYSYRVFTQKGNLRSSGHLKMVIEGERNLTHDSLEKFANALDLKTKKDKKTKRQKAISATR